MKSETQMEGSVSSNFPTYGLNRMKRSSKSHPRAEVYGRPSSLSLSSRGQSSGRDLSLSSRGQSSGRDLSLSSRGQSSGRDPRLLDMTRAWQRDHSPASLPSQTSQHSNWMEPSLASSDVNTDRVYPIKWDQTAEWSRLNRNDDAMSISSISTTFRSHPSNSCLSSRLSEGVKRKRGFNSEAISDDDDDVFSTRTSPKRPRTPLPNSIEDLNLNIFDKIKIFTRKLLQIILKFALLSLSLLVVLLCYTAYKNSQCSHLR